VSARLPDAYFDRLYAGAEDPWNLQARWYERRKYAITMAMLPDPRYRHAFEPGCSIGVLTEHLSARCDRVTSTDVVAAALDATARRLLDAERRDRVTLLRRSLDEPWPDGPFDLLVLSEVGYYLHPEALRAVLDREVPRLAPGATVLAAHWRHRVDDYPMTGDRSNKIVGATAGLHSIAAYRDTDLGIDVFDTATDASVAARTGVPGA
jgi:Nodulation protein S (NodS)